MLEMREKERTQGMASDKAPERRASIGAQRNPASEEAILNAAAEILAEGGFGAFSIEAVARRAKAGKPTIYRWWPSKAALLLDVYQRQKTFDAQPDTGDVERDLAIFLKSLLSFWAEGPQGNIFRSIIAEAQSDPAAEKALSDYAADRRIHTGEIIRRAQERGQVPAETDASLLAETIAGFAWGRLLTGNANSPPEELERAVHQMVAGIIRP